MDILAPWSLASYLPLNGFHPLYRSLARAQVPGARIVVPRKPGFDQYRNIISSEGYQDRHDTPSPDWLGGVEGKLMYHEFVEAHGPDELWLQSNVSGDVELHHTAPATRGDRPFLLHCESFLPIFFPFFQQGVEQVTAKIDSVRAFYRDMFESRNCLGLVSHVPETLEQLSSFFQSSIIDSKLVNMPIGLDPAYIAERIEKPTDTTNFVFLSSSGQNKRSFALRGGASALKLALELLRERSDVSFYFRDQRPTDSVLASHGIDIQELKSHEGNRIVWIEHYLPDGMQANLIARCHFLLLPSANLHSASIMSALANGTIPVVTDTIGTDIYVEDMVNGVVLRGVRAAVWTKDDGSRVVFDRHAKFFRMETELTATLIARMRDVLANPSKMLEMADAARKTIRQRFDGLAFADRLIGEVQDRSARASGNTAQRQQTRRAEGERCIEDISHSHFEGPSWPMARVRLSNGSVYQYGKHYAYVPLRKAPEFERQPHSWSLLRFANDEFDPNVKRHERTLRTESLSQCVEFARLSRKIVSTQAEHLGLRERIWFLLRPYRGPYLAARATYRALRRFGIMR